MEPLLFVPGLMCDAGLYGPQIEALSRTRPVHVACIAQGGDTVAALASAVLDGAPPRFALAGLSMGGIVAMEMIAQAPERVGRLALLDTEPFAESEKVAGLRKAQIARAEGGDLEGLYREEILPHFLASGSARTDILDRALATALALGPEVFARQSRALLTRRDQQETLRSVCVQSLVLCGAQDRLCPVKRHTLMHGLIPGAALEIVEDAGHLPTLEAPEAVNAALVRWLAAAPG